MTVNTAGGATLSIGDAGEPANQGAFETVSYIEVGEVEDLGQFGDEAQPITFAALADGRVRKFKGPKDAGTMAIVVGHDTTDTGQAAMEAAEGQPLNYPFRVQLNDKQTLGGTGTIYYFYGQVMSRRVNVGNVSNVVRENFNVGVNSAPIKVAST